MVNLTKLFQEEYYDITLQPQGEGPYGHAVTCKLETMEASEASLRTKRKVTITGFGKSEKLARNSALKEALRLIDKA